MERELEDARREQSDFAKTDPVYQTIRDAAIAKIREQPGILQTELYKILSSFERDAIQYAMYFADDHGTIIRTKKGRTYSLSLP
jgi:predicted transcriptional regulator